MDHFGVLCFVFLLCSCQFIAALLSPAEERAELFDLLCVIFYCFFFVTFPCGGQGQVLCLIVLIPYLCLISYFHLQDD